MPFRLKPIVSCKHVSKRENKPQVKTLQIKTSVVTHCDTTDRVPCIVGINPHGARIGGISRTQAAFHEQASSDDADAGKDYLRGL